MATYAIGDIQGCFDELQALLKQINFNPQYDTLWFSGDLVNRGKKSLETLRFIKNLGPRAISVLGNHDLHLLATVYADAPVKGFDTLAPILEAPDCAELCTWLRHQPLLHHDETLGYTMTHAGIFPEWDLLIAKACAREVEAVLQTGDFQAYFINMYGNSPHHWDPKITGWDRLRFITNVFTRMRLCGVINHRLNLKLKGALDKAPAGYVPWFKVADRQNKNLNIIFGHWAALEGQTFGEPGVFALDTGCVWGNCLTAMRLEDRKTFSTPCSNAVIAALVPE